MCKPIYILAFLFIFAQACEEPVEIQLPEEEMQLVVQAELSPDKGIVLNLTKSISGINITQPKPVEEANIKISENGREYINEQTSSINIQPLYANLAAGSEYGLIVEVPGFENVYAHDQIPAQIPFSNFDELYYHQAEVFYVDEENHSKTIDFHVHVRFNEPREIKNFYHLIARPILQETSTDVFLQATHIRGNDNLLEIQNDFKQGLLFSDLSNTAGTMRLEFFVRTVMDLEVNVDDIAFEIETRNVSPAYYKFHSSVSSNIASSNPYADPSVLESNIKNGLGAFVAYNPTIIRTR